MTETTFANPALQARFEEDGFVILRGLLRWEELNRLREVYRSQDGAARAPRPVHYTLDHPDRTLVRRVGGELIDVLGGAMRGWMPDLQVIAATFATKEAHPESVTPLHQDWTFVDETRYRSATVWAPLGDVDLDDGALGVAHGSHRFFGTALRCSPGPHCPSPLDRHGFALFPFLDVQRVRAGDAVAFDNALVHGAPPNVTARRRLAACISVTRAAAQPRHSYLVPGSVPPEVVTYAADWDFHAGLGNDALSRLFTAGRCPEGVVLDRKAHRFEPISREALLALVQAHGRNRFQPALARRLAPLAGGYGTETPADPGAASAPDA